MKTKMACSGFPEKTPNPALLPITPIMTDCFVGNNSLPMIIIAAKIILVIIRYFLKPQFPSLIK